MDRYYQRLKSLLILGVINIFLFPAILGMFYWIGTRRSSSIAPGYWITCVIIYLLNPLSILSIVYAIPLGKKIKKPYGPGIIVAAVLSLFIPIIPPFILAIYAGILYKREPLYKDEINVEMQLKNPEEYFKSKYFDNNDNIKNNLELDQSFIYPRKSTIDFKQSPNTINNSNSTNQFKLQDILASNQKSFDQIIARLEKMHELKEKGIISDDDFQKFKDSVL